MVLHNVQFPYNASIVTFPVSIAITIAAAATSGHDSHAPWPTICAACGSYNCQHSINIMLQHIVTFHVWVLF